MKKVNDCFNKILSLVLIICLITSMFSGCAPVSNLPKPEIDTEAIAETITSELQNQAAEIQTEPLCVTETFSVDWFVYDRIFSDYSLVYDTFPAVLHLSDGTEITGFGYTDYASFYEGADGGNGYFPAGFIANVEGKIPYEDTESGLIIENLDYTDDKYQFVYAYDTDPFMEHCVVNGQYLKYGVNESGAITYDVQTYQRGFCDEALGALYSYDDGKFLYDPDMGAYIPITGTSLFESIDYAALEDKINRIIEEQDIHFSEQDIVTSAHIAQEAVISYFLSMQEETFLGYSVEKLVACAEELDPMECIRITPEGHVIITVEGTPPEGADALSKWVVGVGCGITVIGTIALGIFFPAATPFCGTISSAAISVFMQVVIENKAVENIQWSKVAVAAVTGAMLAWACPMAAGQVAASATKALGSKLLGKLCGYGMLTLSNSVVSGVTACATEMLDGRDFAWDTFLTAASIGAICTVVGSGLTELCSKAAPHITELLARTKPGQWLNKATGKIGLFIGKHQIHLKSQKLEEILIPKSVHEAARQAAYELGGQSPQQGGGYAQLKNNGTEKHEMPAYSAVMKGTGNNIDRQKANLPAIKMSPEDHAQTASFGHSKEAIAYQKKQAQLVGDGKFREALQMDIDDITSKFGSKYNKAIKEMLKYTDDFLKNTEWLVIK